MTEETQDAQGTVNAKEVYEPPKTLPKDQEWNHVEFTEDQQKRFNRMYAQVKTNEARVKELVDLNKGLMDKVTALEAGNQERETKSEIESLKAARKQAREDGDYEKEEQIEEQIYAARSKAEKKPEKVEEKQEPERIFTPDQEDRMREWAVESDKDGNPLRPWADPGHPKHTTFLKEVESVLDDPDMQGSELEDYLKEVDRICNIRFNRAERSNPAVLSSTARPKKSTKPPTLTDAEKFVASKMGLSEEVYAKRKQSLSV